MRVTQDSFPKVKPSSLRILSYTNLFPNQIRQNFGIFIQNRLSVFANQTGATLDVVAPVPYFPALRWPKQWAVYSQIPQQEKRDGFEVYHPRYVVAPKIGMVLHGLSMYWGTFKLVSRLHQIRSYHLIDAHWVYPDGWAAVHIGKRLGIPVIVSARGNDINEYLEFPKIRPKIKWCLEQCSHIISVCQGLKDIMLPLGIPDSKVTVVGNGIDTTKFYPIPKEEARQKHALDIQRQVLLSVGILEPRKGHHLLIEAIGILKARGERLPSLYIVGAGPFRNRLEELSKELGVNEVVHFVGEVPHHHLYSWYSAADLLCLASDREGWPNVILESMACGTPVVASGVFGVPEIVRTKDVGFLVDSRTPEAFAAIISDALKTNWHRERIVAYARQHSWERAAEAMEHVIGRVLSH